MKKSPRTDGLTVESYQMFKEELTQILLTVFQKIKQEGTLLNSFYEAIFLIKNQRHYKKKRLQINVLCEYRHKNL